MADSILGCHEINCDITMIPCDVTKGEKLSGDQKLTNQMIYI